MASHAVRSKSTAVTTLAELRMSMHTFPQTCAQPHDLEPTYPIPAHTYGMSTHPDPILQKPAKRKPRS